MPGASAAERAVSESGSGDGSCAGGEREGAVRKVRKLLVALTVLSGAACSDPTAKASDGTTDVDAALSFADTGVKKSDAKAAGDSTAAGDAVPAGTDAATTADPDADAAGAGQDTAQGSEDAATGTDAGQDAAGPEDVPASPDAAALQDTAAVQDIAAVQDDAAAAQDVAPVADVVSAPDVTAAPDVAGPPPEPVVRFAALGDTGKGNDTQYKVGAAMAQKCKASGCDFVLMLGDDFYPTGVSSENDGQFKQKFEDPYKDVDAPFYVVLGNHDYGGEGAGYELWKGDHYKKYSKKNPKFYHPDNNYDKVVQHVHLFGMDSNLMMYGLGGPQVQKFADLIAKSTATWKISFAHHPYLSNGKHGNAGAYEGIPGIPIVSGEGVKQAYDKIVCGKVDVLITGHDHSRQWLEKSGKCPGVELLVSGAGASTTEIKKKDWLFTPSPAYFADAAKGGFLWVEIKGKAFHGEFYDEDGKLQYQRDFSKP